MYALMLVRDLLWRGPLLVLLPAAGVLLTWKLRGLQLRGLPRALRLLAAGDDGGEGEVSPFQALCTALAATIGTGNIVGVATAVSVLADSPGEWKAAILGDMLELGPFAPALHAGVGEYLGTVGVDCLVAVGELSSSIVQGARDAGVPQVIHCKTREEAKEVLPQVVRPDSTILVKASRGMKLEELTARLLELTAEP